MDARSTWDDLPPELLPKIAKSIHNYVDLLRYHSACTSWRYSIPPSLPNHASLFPLRISNPVDPSIIIPLSLSTFYHIQPTHHPSSSSSPKGWLLRLHKKSKSKLYILNPLSNQRLSTSSSKAPPMIFNLLDYQVVELHKSYNFPKRFRHFKKVVLFPTSCWSNVEDLVVCCIFQRGKLALFKRAENKWTLVGDVNFHYDDVILYKGQFYVTDRWGVVSWIDTCSCKLIRCSPCLDCEGHQKHLVESCGSLYMVVRYYDVAYKIAVMNFEVYRLDEEWHTWVEVKDLKDRILMLGDNGNFSISANDFDGYKGNCILFTDIFGVRMYNLDDGSIMNYAPNSQLFWPPPSWFRIEEPNSRSSFKQARLAIAMRRYNEKMKT